MGTGDIAREAKEKRLLNAAETYVGRLGEATMYIAKAVEDPPGGEVWLKSVTLKVRYGAEGDVLAILKAESGEGKLIAFHSGDTVDEVWQGIANRLRNGSFKWREDKPYGER